LLTVLELSETARPTLRNDADKLGPRNLDVHIHKLRRDLRVAGAPVTIENVKGVGYRLDAAGRLFLTMLMREFAA
jgi:DNA-binding response OmpR family regulator